MSLLTIKTLLANTIDFAGTFPPAKLSVGDALKEAASYFQWMKCPWLYSKMVLPFDEVKKIKALDYLKFNSSHFPWYWTVLSNVSMEEAQLEKSFENIVWELREVAKWNEKNIFGSFYRKIFSYEVKVSESSFEILLDQLLPLSDLPLIIYFEPPFELVKSERVFEIAEKIAAFKAEHKTILDFGVKIRTGGANVPTSQMLSSALTAIIGNQLKFKATQGLHEVTTHGKDFGFLNLFAALNFLQHFGLGDCSEEVLKKILEETNPKAFSFSEESFSWGQLQMELNDIEVARKIHGASFGSCSLKEPDDSLFKNYLEKK